MAAIPYEASTTLADLIPLAAPCLEGRAWDYIRECLDSNWVSSAGPYVSRFERMVADYLGVPYAVATVNGTAALHIALLVAGVQPDEEVLVSTLTFIASANAVRYVGAWPIFIDADPQYWQMDPEAVVCFLQRECQWRNGALYNRHTRRRVKAILPVHILGHPVHLEPILQLARKYDLLVIEDAAEALGAFYKECPVGCLGDIACFSFNGNKIITCGGGGMLVTRRADWAERARYLTTQAKDDPVEYIHCHLGYNYRLTNLQAALGCAQMEKLDEFVQRKRQLARYYSEHLADLPGLVLPAEAPWAKSTYWLYTILFQDKNCISQSREVMRWLRQQGIECRPLWQPLHRSPVYSQLPRRICPVADRLYQQALSLPSSVGLTCEQQERVIHALKTWRSSSNAAA
ncbi:MAG: LegC family aminotransferase [Gemmatales bacterium]|nr:LegC family aminotransferase [Gemmatales bacterium]MCS7160283.1 LegC family aminotransferase [Gemmatales bacterium]MDW8175483.1 LegC family aminotransferase [Gemmatales bacterium]MDW8222619.1 LegC family aminotransferase [Gemmatales bacterium]